MINQVATNTSYNTLNHFALNKQDKNFFVTQKYEPPKQDKSHKKIITLAASALTAGFLVLGLMKGPKGFSKSLEKLKTFLEKKVTSSKAMGPVKQFYLTALDRTNSFITKCDSINNFTSIKDALCKKLMEKRKWSKKLYDKVTKVYERTSRETVLTSWHNTKHNLNTTFKKFDALDEKFLAQNSGKPFTIDGVTKTGREWVETLRSHRKEMSAILEENTNKSNLTSRYKKIKSATQECDRITIDIFRDWKNKDLYQSYAADKAIMKDKISLYRDMNLFREQISFNRRDKLLMAQDLIKKTEPLIKSKDYQTIQMLTGLKDALEKGVDSKTLTKQIEEIATALKNGTIKTDEQALVSEMLSNAKSLINNKNEGKMQEMLRIYEKLLPDEYKKINKAAGSTVKSIDKSINIEAEQFFDKVRDLQIGSAPTDVISMLVSLGLIGAGLAKADNKDERISVMLKAGIPIIGTLGTTIYCTARLVSGSKAMAAGLVSGWIINRIGEQADKFRKKYNAKNEESNPNVL